MSRGLRDACDLHRHGAAAARPAVDEHRGAVAGTNGILTIFHSDKFALLSPYEPMRGGSHECYGMASSKIHLQER
jgi:hypothetical protein